MLDDRPVLQKSLIGFGAFSFIFFAAMSGTAFMISGGFDLNAPERSHQTGASEYVNLVQDTWSDWATPEASASTYAPATYAPQPAPATTEEPVYEDARYAPDELVDGDGASQAHVRTEAEVTRDIDAEYAAAQAREQDRHAADIEATANAEDDPVKDGQY